VADGVDVLGAEPSDSHGGEIIPVYVAVPDQMHAVFLMGHGGLKELVYRRDVPVPKPRHEEVLVEVRATSVNNTDINTRVGWYSRRLIGSTSTAAADRDGKGASWAEAPIRFPRIQGADVCGVIVAVGEGVPAARIGERVIVESCLRSLRQDDRDSWLGSEVDGGFAQFVCVPAAEAHRIDCALSDAHLGAVPCAYGTAENLLYRAGVAKGERVLVTGASGGVGSAAVQLACLRGAHVTAIVAEEKRDAIRALGAVAVRRDAELAATVRDETFDAVIDVVGGRRWRDLLDVLRPGGRCAVAGAIAGPLVELDLRTLYLNDLTLFGCTSHDPQVFPRVVAYLEDGELVPLVARTYPLEAIAEAQRDFQEKRHFGKLVLIPPSVGA
jgi:NADPH:quinone reductase-like Zn-dependent oxidoreductase